MRRFFDRVRRETRSPKSTGNSARTQREQVLIRSVRVPCGGGYRILRKMIEQG